MFPNPSQPLVHLQRNPHPPPPPPAPQPSAASPDPNLPRGECRFLTTRESGIRERCPCQRFSLKPAIPGSQCDCGHLACYHELEPVATVPLDEHLHVMDRVKELERRIEVETLRRQEDRQRLEDANTKRETEYQHFYRSIELVYLHLKQVVSKQDGRMLQVEDNVERVMNDQHVVWDMIRGLREKLELVDESAMDIENRLERREIGRWLSRSLTPVSEATVEPPLTHSSSMPDANSLPIQSNIQRPWTVRAIFVPRKTQQYAFDPDSIDYRRCASRNLHQELNITDQDSAAFISAVEKAFGHVLRGRPWTPLVGRRASSQHLHRILLHQLPEEQQEKPDMWEYSFLGRECVWHDKFLGDVIYIALLHDELTMDDIKQLPANNDLDQSCWEPQGLHETPMKNPRMSLFKMDSDSVYRYSDPPPYMPPSGGSSAVGVHRGASPGFDGGVSSPSSSRLDPFSPRSPSQRDSMDQQSISGRSLGSLGMGGGGSGGSGISYEGSDDERNGKRLRRQRSESHLKQEASGTMYVSGRSKRKMTAKPPKPREHPRNTPIQNLLSRSDRKGGAAGAGAHPHAAAARAAPDTDMDG
ncbi:hypothetical protein BDY21DRAFT_365012 [Lineolata rhizophorae]|uniref:Uncharacterized protein n=1 Tax=Lineolata rhizophorae TaxID=578093 RepID=A0A6A6NWA7_9PEZI|nr:hypothetical protein BDY21DRAFT_365012 [Lineolata rhizophorae]